jgi:RNA polymerase-binding transcription factor DksA
MTWEYQMTDYAKIKTKLEAKLRELTERVEHIDEDLSQPADDDWEENALDSADDEVLERVGGVTREEIRQIRFALSQIASGTYGVCTTCGKSIAPERLKALPYASKCVKCS